MQVVVPVQAVPHDPQLALFERGSTQLPPHVMSPVPHVAAH